MEAVHPKEATCQTSIVLIGRERYHEEFDQLKLAHCNAYEEMLNKDYYYITKL